MTTARFHTRTLGAVAAVATAATLALSGCASSPAAQTNNSATDSQGNTVDLSTVTSAQGAGGMAALIAAAKKEGQLNVITLPRDWAGYGALMDNFSKKYGIHITDANPDGSSAQEITAITTLKSQPKGPDVVDVGQSYALSGSQDGIFATYKVATWNNIPSSLKDTNGMWANDYGGYVSIGCDTSKVSTCPTSFADLNNPMYKGKVALDGDPTQANAAFNAVWAAALAKGGSYDDIKPGIDYFGQLKKAGVYVPIQATEATIESGETPIVIDWDYLNAAKADALKAKGRTFSVAVPKDGVLPGYYVQAISKYAPHPAAARLWEEYLYSVEGQNGFLKGYARPAEMTEMTTAKTIDAELAAKLPAVSGSPKFPSDAQTTKAKDAVTANWASTVQ